MEQYVLQAKSIWNLLYLNLSIRMCVYPDTKKKKKRSNFLGNHLSAKKNVILCEKEKEEEEITCDNSSCLFLLNKWNK